MLLATASADVPAYAGPNEFLDAAAHPVLPGPGELPRTGDSLTSDEAVVLKRLSAVELNRRVAATGQLRNNSIRPPWGRSKLHGGPRDLGDHLPQTGCDGSPG